MSGHTDLTQAAWLESDFSYDQTLNLWTLKARAGEFGYSDGDINEEYLLDTIRSAKDRSVLSAELSRGMKDWPSVYHLHHQRCNVFRAITQHLDGPILEIGAGCGVLTRFLGEQGYPLYALEGSNRRATITGERCRDLENVRVINANFQDFKPDIRFKTITLIGVLEYARVYFSDGSDTDPVDQMLRSVSTILEPDGVLIIAIENQLGLKYFAGYPEDHYGKSMFGVEDRYTDDTIVTFGRAELKNRIVQAGLTEVEFAYPFPDYKFPQAVLFEPALSLPVATQFAPMVAGANASDRQKPIVQNFSMPGAVKSVMKNGLGADMANSFIVIASKSDDTIRKPEDALAIYYGNGNRKNEYLKSAKVFQGPEGLRIERSLLTDVPQDQELDFNHVLEDEGFAEGTLWSDEFQKIFLDEDWKIGDLATWAQVWAAALLSAAGKDGEVLTDKDEELPGRLLDALPRNLVVEADGSTKFFDLEWQSKTPLRFGFLFARGLTDSLRNLELVSHSSQPTEILEIVVLVAKHLGLEYTRFELETYLAREKEFQNAVSRYPVVESRLHFLPTRPSEKKIINQIRRRRKWFRNKFKVSLFFGKLTGRGRH